MLCFNPFVPFMFPRFRALTSSDCDRPSLLALGSDFGASGAESQCLAKSDLLSSIGVKMLCCLDAGSGLG
jgi:hypothetical protein